MHISEESFIEANGVSVPGNYDFEHNFFFTSEMRMWFKYESRGHMQIEVVADDDTWVFVNGRLAIDLGGIHRPAGGDADLQDGADDFGLEDGGIYEIAIFHAERYRDVSAFRLTLSGFESPRSRCASECGDGILTAGEQCDDGVNDGGYNKCAPGCTLDEYCGDGMIQEEYEDCDDGNLENGDECPNSCVRGELH
jgi:fibro-slime domain-containing protein